MKLTVAAEDIRSAQRFEARAIRRSKLRIARALKKARVHAGSGADFDAWLSEEVNFSRRQAYNLLKMLEAFEARGDAIFEQPTWGEVYSLNRSPRQRAKKRRVTA